MKTTRLRFLVWFVSLVVPTLVALHFHRQLKLLRSTPTPHGTDSQQTWICPMHPHVQSENPSTCPICGMDLVAKKSLSQPQQTPTLHLSLAQQSLLGLKTTQLDTGPLGGSSRTTGRVVYDETRLHHVHLKSEAYIEELHANFVGKYVRKGELLASLYSPELYAAQQEYVIAKRTLQGKLGKGFGENLVSAAQAKLLLWGMNAADIATLDRQGRAQKTVPLYSPASGYVTAKTAAAGMRTKPEDTLFEIVDLSRVWVLADVYETELPRLKLGQNAAVRLSYWPGRVWHGEITFISPAVDPKTRVVRARIEVENVHSDLKADMFADLEIAGEKRTVLLLPEDAVIDTGKRKIVFVKTQEGSLVRREVQTGEQAGPLFEVIEGLQKGETVVLGASFLLDSEARLQGVP